MNWIIASKFTILNYYKEYQFDFVNNYLFQMLKKLKHYGTAFNESGIRYKSHNNYTWIQNNDNYSYNLFIHGLKIKCLT